MEMDSRQEQRGLYQGSELTHDLLKQVDIEAIGGGDMDWTQKDDQSFRNSLPQNPEGFSQSTMVWSVTVLTELFCSCGNSYESPTVIQFGETDILVKATDQFIGLKKEQ